MRNDSGILCESQNWVNRIRPAPYTLSVSGTTDPANFEKTRAWSAGEMTELHSAALSLENGVVHIIALRLAATGGRKGLGS